MRLAGTTIKDFPGAEDLFNALISDDIDAVLQGFPVNQYPALKASERFAVTETFKTGEQYASPSPRTILQRVSDR